VVSLRRYTMPLVLTEAPRDVGIGIRTALSLDLSQVMEIERLAFGGQWSYHEFKASLDDVFLVAVDAATASIVGFVISCCCQISRRGLILRVAVHPDYEGRGIATQLLNNSFSELKKKNLVEEMELDVDILKAGAIHLYEKVGFRSVEVFSTDFEEDETFYIMRRKL
jgi:ribosomal-protein-alanine N-acetyltransferase